MEMVTVLPAESVIVIGYLASSPRPGIDVIMNAAMHMIAAKQMLRVFDSIDQSLHIAYFGAGWET
jgi:hypothetical protein